MATVGKINVIAAMNTSGLAKGAKQGETILKKFGSAVTSVKGMLLGLGSALALGAGANWLKGLTQDSMESIDSLAKVADSMGITTEALASLRHGAGLSGVEVEGLDKALTVMMKNIGGNSKEFDKLGLDPEKLKGQDTVESFGQIADAIMKLPNAAERADTAMAIFGKSGMNLMPMLAGGSAGIKEMADEAERLGITFNRVDAAKVELANDAMSRLGTVVTSLGNELAIQLAPIIQGIAESLTGAANEGLDFGKIVSQSISWVIKGAGVLADVWHTVKLAFTGLQVLVQKGLALMVRGLTEAIKFMERQVNNVLAILPDWAKEKVGLNGPIDMSSGLEQFAQSLEQSASDASNKWMEAFTGKTPSEKLNAWYDEVVAKSDAAAKEIADAAKKTNEVATPKLDFGFSGEDASRWLFNMKAKAKDLWNGLGDMKGKQPELDKIEMKQPELILKGSNEANKLIFDWQQMLEGDTNKPMEQVATETKAQTSILQDILLALKEKYVPDFVEDVVAQF